MFTCFGQLTFSSGIRLCNVYNIKNKTKDRFNIKTFYESMPWYVPVFDLLGLSSMYGWGNLLYDTDTEIKTFSKYSDHQVIFNY